MPAVEVVNNKDLFSLKASAATNENIPFRILLQSFLMHYTDDTFAVSVLVSYAITWLQF